MIQAKRTLEEEIDVLDLMEDEFRRRQVRLSSRKTRMVQWTDAECRPKLLNRTLQVPFLSVLSVTRKSPMALVCCVF